jgi:phosphoenolpyruvate phosphomutase
VFRAAGISLVIWANHLIRAAVDAMQETAARIHTDQSLVEVEDQIASVKEIFRLQGAEELAAAERRYVLDSRRASRAVILAASRGEGMDELTLDRPKVMLPINGKPLLRRLVERCRKQQVDAIAVVAGYKASGIDVGGVDVVVNERFAVSGEVASLACARHLFADDMVILYGDLIFRGYILRGLIESDRELTVVVDSQGRDQNPSGEPDFAFCSSADDRALWGQDVLLRRVSRAAIENGEAAQGRWLGMLRTRARGREWLEQALDELAASPDFDRLSLGELVNHLIAKGHPIRVIYIHGHWLDINTLRDLEQAGRFTAGQR